MPVIAELYTFVLERLPEAPVAKRARLCRALAEIVGDESAARDLISQAEQLEYLDVAHGQLVLRFRSLPPTGGAA